jgi:hypothetical protein
VITPKRKKGTASLPSLFVDSILVADFIHIAGLVNPWAA